MRAYVFTDPALTRQAGRFVWLALDSEKEANAPENKRLGLRALPTFFVLDPTDERVAIRWVGGASLAQLSKLLDDGATAVAASYDAAPAPRARADQALERADQLYGAGDYAAASRAYAEALRAPA